MTTTCVPRNGGSDCVGARAFSGLLAVLAGTAATVCTAGEPCAMCETCNRLILRALRQVVDSTVGDVVQLVRMLPPLARSSKTLSILHPRFCSPKHTQSHKFSSHSNVTGLSTSYSFKTHFGFWREPETTLIVAIGGLAQTTPWTVWLCQSCSTTERRAGGRAVTMKCLYSTSWRFRAMRTPFTKTTL